MSAVHRDLLIEQGVSFSQAWTVHLDGAELDPAAGWQARAQVRAKVVSTDVLHEFTCAVLDSVVQLSVLPSQSAAWAWKRGVYDVEIFDTSTPPRVVRVVQGTVGVSPEVTREPV